MSKETTPSKNNSTSIFGKIWHGLKGYLTDWRNLLGHALIGVLFLVVAIWVPVQLWIKLIVIVCLITFNVIRMRLKAKKAAKQAAEVTVDND